MIRKNHFKYILFSISAFIIINIVCVSKILAVVIDIEAKQYMNKVVCANLGQIGVGDYKFPIPIGAKETFKTRRQAATIYNFFYGMPYDGKAILAEEDYGVFFCGGATQRSWFGDGDYNYGGGLNSNADRVVYSNPTAQIFFSKIGVAKAQGKIDDNVKQYLIYEPDSADNLDPYGIHEPNFVKGKVLEQLDEIMGYINDNKEMWQYAQEMCNKYCSSCVDNGYAYACRDDQLRDGYYALGVKYNHMDDSKQNGVVYSDIAFAGNVEFDVPKLKRVIANTAPVGSNVFYEKSAEGVIGKAKNEKETKLMGKHSCMNLLFTSEDIGGTRRYWYCEDKINCIDSCEGTCISPKDYQKYNYNTKDSSESRLEISDSVVFRRANCIDTHCSDLDKEPFICYGTKKKNVVFPNGDSTEDPKYYTTSPSDIEKMSAYKGDGIAASLGNIYKVGTGKITCQDVFGENDEGQLAKILREVFKYMRIVGVALFLIFTTIDFIKGISSSDEKPMKAVTKNLTTRFIVLLILLVLPTLLNIVLSIVEIKNGLCFLN